MLTMAGLEVEEITFAGLPLPANDDHGFKVSGIAWDRDKIVVAQIDEVAAPQRRPLTLCDLYDGKQQHIVLTGAPNLFPYKGQGRWPSRSRWPMPKKARASTTVTSPARC
jgi:phenylalanyl-tRNA synthetase beta chain